MDVEKTTRKCHVNWMMSALLMAEIKIVFQLPSFQNVCMRHVLCVKCVWLVVLLLLCFSGTYCVKHSVLHGICMKNAI